jgi:hypothetical protein
LFLLVKESGCLLNKHEVILIEPLLDEGWLICGNHPMKPARQPISKDLSNQLGEAMHQTDRSIILSIMRRLHLGQ